MSGGAVVMFTALAIIAAIGWLRVLRLRKSIQRLGGSVEVLAGQLKPDPDNPPTAHIAGPDVVTSIQNQVQHLKNLIGDLRSDATLREQILSSMSEGVLLLETTGKQAYANPAAAELLGASATVPPEVLSEKIVEFTIRNPQPRELRAVSEDLPDGRRLTVIQDVTEPRRIDSVRRDFVANVSHELKTPVAGILASAETLEVVADEDPSGIPKFMSALLREARRLSKLVEDLLDLAKLEQQSPAVDLVNLSRLVSVEVGQIKELAAAKSLSVKTALAGDLWVVGAGEDLRLAVGNVLVNAVRYTEAGEIRVRLFGEKGWAFFEVTDTGVGIPAKDLPRIFERFYRVDKARSSQTGGTGLGLSIVKHAAERHGGEVVASSELGCGSTFTLKWPLSIQTVQTNLPSAQFAKN